MVTAVDGVVPCYDDSEFGYDDGVVVVMVTMLSAVMVE